MSMTWCEFLRNYLVCMGGLPACVPGYHMCLGPWTLEKRASIPTATGVRDD